MQFVNPTLGPADIKEILRNTSRVFPAVSPLCTTALCGDGIVDAQAAVQAAASFGTATPRISAGNATTAGLRSDGTWWSWGNNGAGQFGVSSPPATSANPFQAPTLAGIVLGTSGQTYALGIRADAVLFSWGDNTFGQLGRSTGTPTVPGTVAGLTSVTQTSGGKFHTLAQKSEAFGCHLRCEGDDPGRVGAWPVQTCDKPQLNRRIRNQKVDRDCSGRFLVCRPCLFRRRAASEALSSL